MAPTPPKPLSSAEAMTLDRAVSLASAQLAEARRLCSLNHISQEGETLLALTQVLATNYLAEATRP